MSDEFVVRKGAAAPAAAHPGGIARFHARRAIVLPAINLHNASKHAQVSGAPPPTKPRRAARLTGTAAVERRKFTFRIDPARHAEFCRAAELRNVSRQHLLTTALDELLRRLAHHPDQTGTMADTPHHRDRQPASVAPLSPVSTAAVPQRA